MQILLIIAVVIFILTAAVADYRSKRCRQLKLENKFLKDSLSKINESRIEYHSHKNDFNNLENFYRRRLLSTLDDVLLSIFKP